MKSVTNTSRFSSFVGKAVKSGTKVSGSTNPQLILQSTKDKFKLNEKAAALMGIDAGSYVVLLDVNRGAVETEKNSDRYFITKGYTSSTGGQAGAKIGKKLDFSYSGIWAAILMNKPEVTECKTDDLLALGLGTISDKSENFISNKKVIMDVRPFEVEGEDGIVTEFEVAPGVTQKIYILTNLNFVDHDIKVNDEDDDSSDSE